MREEHVTRRIIFIITRPGDDQGGADSASPLGGSLQREGTDLVIFFTFEGANPAKKGAAETAEGSGIDEHTGEVALCAAPGLPSPEGATKGFREKPFGGQRDRLQEGQPWRFSSSSSA